MVASDRISAFDFVLPTTIPDKGRILTAMSLWWFERLEDLVATTSSTAVPAEYAGRAILCRRLDMYPVECVARDISPARGSPTTGARGPSAASRCRPDSADGSRLPEPVFTPPPRRRWGSTTRT